MLILRFGQPDLSLAKPEENDKTIFFHHRWDLKAHD
jgi:hypothetical protein